MRIVNVGINLVPEAGGIARSVQLFVAAQQQLGLSSVVSFGRRGFYEPGSHGPGSPQSRFITVPSLPLLRKYYWWPGGYGSGARALFGEADLVVIHGLFFHPGVVAARFARQRGVPYVVVSHGSLDPLVFRYRSWRKKAWMWQAGRTLLDRASAIVFSTERERRKAARWSNGRSHVVHWPVAYVPDYDKAAAIRKVQTAWGLPESTRIALFCGRIHPIKCPLETIRAFQAAAPQDWVLLVVGPPTPEIPTASIEKACGATNGRCRYAGPLFGEALHDYYRAAELFVLFSHKENFSHVTAEALAFGVPVVLSTGVDLSHELAEAGVDCSLTVGEMSVEAFARALANILSRPPAELAAMGERGRRWARETLSFGGFREKLWQLYHQCTREAAGSSSGRRS